MAKIEMVMPQMGESITEGTILQWYKNVGDRVEKDENILEISTDKVDSEIPSPESGVITKLLAKEDDTVEVGSVIAWIETDIEAAKSAIEAAQSEASSSAPVPQPESQPEPVPAPPAPTPQPESQPEPLPAPPAPAAPAPQPETPVPQERSRFFSPLVQRIAKEEGISMDELESIPGTGDRGRVTKKDLLNYLERRKAAPVPPQPAAAPAAPKPPAVPTSIPAPAAAQTVSRGNVDIVEMDNMRKLIAKHMVHSIQTSPHVTATTEVDMTHIVNYREKYKAQFFEQEGVKLTPTPFIADAVIKALKEYPWVNGSVEGDQIIIKKYINLGIAVALPNAGLIVPVIKNADQLSMRGMAIAINDLADRARNKQLRPDEVMDGTFTITNIGVFGNLTGTPIINQPQVAILATGAIKKRPVVIEHPQFGDTIAIRSMMYMTLSFDHRIIDGAMGGMFLEQIARNLENFNPNLPL
ncbi:MAG: 2-oxoglutarate dehydrogenase, E2 component, dihydrolipoamide succinyltransferase [Gemmatimonadetes bacterium]|nr:MAG: 2-oxoglutarate dehydrogenase, E2 component, dihydrolipoamide succinyltransferase [Gemmatimonadota bacterium]